MDSLRRTVAQWIVVGAVTCVVGCSAPESPRSAPGTLGAAVAECERLLLAQRDAWNAGDLEAFVAGYSEQAVFATVNGTRVGRLALLERYRQNYPDLRAMGVLAFHELQFNDLADGHVTARGRWSLERQGDRGPETLGGRFVLVLRPIVGEYRVVLDYTTSEPPPP